MKVLVVGGGGREHTLVWKLAGSPRVDEVYAAPGNAGIASIGTCVPVAADDKQALLDFAREKEIDLTVVGPEAPLVAGIVELFRSKNRRIFGFDSRGALLEGSKIWAKQFMKRHGIPTGGFDIFDGYCAAESFVAEHEPPFVIKADGLAAGKGVMICSTLAEARAAVGAAMKDRAFGEAGSRIIVEEFLRGPEISVLALFDGKDYRLFVPSQDHKRAFDGDLGPNTGGMGAYAPVSLYTGEAAERIRTEIIEPTFEGMRAEGIAGAGVLYFGIMMTGDGPKVLEYNCRFGDPETQVILPLFGGDLFEAIWAATEGRLGTVRFENSAAAAACVVVASGGYPGPYTSGYEITGIDRAREKGCIVFHAGTTMDGGVLKTAGGRVLGVTGLGTTLQEALEAAYAGIDEIAFTDCFSRRDIGRKGLR